MDNLIILTNKIQLSFLKKAYSSLSGRFSSAFDNVTPNILLQDLKKLEISACTYKFVENLLNEHYIVWDGELFDVFFTHKGTP